MKCPRCEKYCRSRAALAEHDCPQEEEEEEEEEEQEEEDQEDSSSESEAESTRSPRRKKARKERRKTKKSPKANRGRKARKRTRRSRSSSSDSSTSSSSSSDGSSNNDSSTGSDEDDYDEDDGFQEELDVVRMIHPANWRSKKSARRAGESWYAELSRLTDQVWVRRYAKHYQLMAAALYSDNKRSISKMKKPSVAAQRNFMAQLQLYVRTRMGEEGTLERELAKLTSRERFKPRLVMKATRKALQDEFRSPRGRGGFRGSFRPRSRGGGAPGVQPRTSPPPVPPVA